MVKDVLLILILSGIGLLNNLSTTIQYSGWISKYSNYSNLKSEYYKDKLQVISPVLYQLDNDGNISEINPEFTKKIRSFAVENNIKLIPSVKNNFKTEESELFFSNLQSIIPKLVNIAFENGRIGIDLDIENLSYSNSKRYTSFLKSLQREFKRNDLLLYVTLQPKKQDDSYIDWKVVGETSDVVRIMLYDFHNLSTDPGPISSYTDIRDTLNYAIKKIDPQKIEAGLPAYGYLWSPYGSKSLSFKQLNSIPASFGIMTRNINSGELNIKGSVENVWFSDSESIRKKTEIIKKFGIYKICLWQIGIEDQSIWQNLVNGNIN